MAAVVDGETNAYYGARNQPRTHIYYTNGGIDPWGTLSMRSDKDWISG